MSDLHPVTPVSLRPRELPMAGDMALLVVRWLEQLQRRGRARNTLASYQYDLEQFLGFMAAKDKHLIQSVNVLDLEQFCDALLQSRGNSHRTVARKQAVVRNFFAYAVRQGVLTEANDPARLMEPVSFRHSPVVAPEAAVILDMIRRIPTEEALDVRDKAMLLLMYDSALRRSSVCSLDVYDPVTPPLHCVHPSGRVTYRSKGGDTKETIVEDATIELLNLWLERRERFVRPSVGTSALFLSRRGTRMNPASVTMMVRRRGAAAGLVKMHPHLLRHRRLGNIMEKVGLDMAHYYAGHGSRATTAAIYGTPNTERLRVMARRDCPVDLGVKEASEC